MIDRPLIDRTERAGQMRRLLIVGGCLVLIAAALALFGHDYGAPALFVSFAVLGTVGIATIFGLAAGLVHIGSGGDEGAAARSFLDGARQGAVFVDEKGRVVYANRSYGAITGTGRADAVRSLEQLLARNPDASQDIYHLANLARQGGVGQREFRLNRALSGEDENARWYRVSVRPITAPSGRLQAWQIADITADRREEETSFRNLQNAIDYLDKAPVGFLAADTASNLTYVNATLANWLGIDLTDFNAFDAGLPQFMPEAARSALAARYSALEPGGSAEFNTDLSTMTGRILPVRMVVQKPAVTANGNGGMRALFLSRAAAGDEGAGEAAEARFTRFFDSSPMAIAALHADAKGGRSNGAFRRLFGDAVADGRASLIEAVNEESAARLGERLTAAANGEAEIPPVDVVMKGERPRTVRAYLSATPDRGRESDEAAILYAVDITEQRSLEEQFAKSQKMQAVGNLAGGIAHDFNNVLTIITASVDFLMMNHRSGDPSFQDLLLIKQSVNRAASLVRQLLAYSRRQTMRPRMLNLTDVIADLDLLLKRIGGDKTRIERRHARDLWPVMADIGQFEQVITNLVGNARDAMADGGTITIATRNVVAEEAGRYGYREMPAADYVMVEIADTGSGMPTEVVERIFEPFFTTKEIGKGTGLGLSMVYGIVKQSNGFIYVDSTPGEGTIFRIFLPRYIEETTVSAKAEAVSAPVQAKMDLSGTASILLVEDEDSVRAGSVRFLKMKGYDVHEAGSGIEALEKLEELDGKIDLVVSDVVMPEMDGPTLLREMRKIRPEMKFIFVSGYAEDAFAKNLPDGESFGFVSKPFNQRDLAVQIKQMLERG